MNEAHKSINVRRMKIDDELLIEISFYEGSRYIITLEAADKLQKDLCVSLWGLSPAGKGKRKT